MAPCFDAVRWLISGTAVAGLLEPESPEKFGLKDKHVLLVLGTAKKKAFRGTHRILARIPTKVIYVCPCTVYSVASVCLQLDGDLWCKRLQRSVICLSWLWPQWGRTVLHCIWSLFEHGYGIIMV
jgi:hypothetical protein